MASTPFESLEDYIALPRVEALALSPDGSRVVLTVAVLKKDGTAYERSLWAVAADGSGTPKRLTRSAKGEAGAAFTPKGDLLFVSARPDADAESDDESGQLWLLPADGGEARPVTFIKEAARLDDQVRAVLDSPSACRRILRELSDRDARGALGDAKWCSVADDLARLRRPSLPTRWRR